MTRTTALIALALLALCAFASAAQQDDATTATRKGYKHKCVFQRAVERSCSCSCSQGCLNQQPTTLLTLPAAVHRTLNSSMAQNSGTSAVTGCLLLISNPISSSSSPASHSTLQQLHSQLPFRCDTGDSDTLVLLISLLRRHHTSGDKEYSYDDDDSSYKKHEHKYHSHDSYDDGSSYKKKDDYEYKENDYSPSYKSYGDGYSGGYYYSPNGWHEGEDHNKAWYHIENHRGDCMANRRVRVTGSGTDGQPLNLATGCPPNAPGNLLNPPAGATPVVPCNTPAFCGDPNSIPVGCGCLTENGPSAGSYPDYVRYEVREGTAAGFHSREELGCCATLHGCLVD